MSDEIKLMQTIRDKLFAGFLLGIGLAVGIALVIYLASEISSMNSGSRSGGNSSARFTSEAESGLKIVAHEDKKNNNILEILATVENTGKTTWSYINVEVELFDKQGKFIDQCSDHIQGKIVPGNKENIKISCSAENLLSYDRYTIAIKDASAY